MCLDTNHLTDLPVGLDVKTEWDLQPVSLNVKTEWDLQSRSLISVVATVFFSPNPIWQ